MGYSVKENIKNNLSSKLTLPILSVAAANVAAAKVTQSIFNNTLSKKEINQANIALNETCSDINRLTNKSNIKIIHVNQKKFPQKTKLPGFIESIFNVYISCSKGKNAFYSIDKNNVCLNRGKIPLAGFHELGHAYNANSSKLLKGLQYMDPVCMTLALGCMFLPSLIKRTPDSIATGEDRVKNKILESAPYIAMGVYAPVVAEEGLASLRASKLAKNNLSPRLLKKMNIGNSFAFLTYLSSMLLFGFMAKDAQS